MAATLAGREGVTFIKIQNSKAMQKVSWVARAYYS